MVKITVDLLRKKAEHHDKQLAPLKEISLHQESIEKIEYVQECCPKLQILLMQSNIISKIENLNKLKELEYLNLAINNIERVENLERCESLQKLDLTLNFIGEITSLETLQNNYNLRLLFLNGNPCTDYKGYREYVITILPQLVELDNEEIKRSDRIIALQRFNEVQQLVIDQQEVYRKKRLEQKVRLENKMEQNWHDKENIDEEEVQRFWSEKTEHSPEVRIEMERLNQLKRDAKKPKEEKKNKRSRSLFAPDGRPFNINEAKVPFIFKTEDVNQFDLEVQLYKHLDTSLINIDLQPMYIRLVIKNKIFQLALPEEINISDSTAKRSQTTGYLLITMKKCKVVNFSKLDSALIKSENSRKMDIKISSHSKKESLELGQSENILDLTKITKQKNSKTTPKYSSKPGKYSNVIFEDDTNVPPLI